MLPSNYGKTLKDVHTIPRKICSDPRGIFYPSLLEDITPSSNIHIVDNVTNVFRGLHVQINGKEQTKIVQVIKGIILDYVVDLDPQSDTFGKYRVFDMNENSEYKLKIPKGFAHGYYTFSDTVIAYQIDEPWEPKNELIINGSYVLTFLLKNTILSNKDKIAPTLENICKKLNIDPPVNCLIS